MMKALVTLVFSCCVLALNAQLLVDYPYNPDSDDNAQIGVNDLTSLLAVFGGEFESEAILVDGVALTEVLTSMQQTIESLQLEISELQSQVIPGLASYVHIIDSTDVVMFDGANVQIVNGSPNSTAGSALLNGKGNLLIGYNPQGADTTYARTGSHNLVIGWWNDYNGRHSIVHGLGSNANGTFSASLASYYNKIDGAYSSTVGGQQNEILDSYAVAMGGMQNQLSGELSAAVGGRNNSGSGYAAASVAGQYNSAEGQTSVILAGVNNTTEGLRSAIVGGNHNNIEVQGDVAVVVGGQGNDIFNGSASVLIGGESNMIGLTDSLDSRFSVLSGGRFNELKSGYCGFIGGGYGNILEPDTAFSSPQCRAILGGLGNENFGSNGASIVGGRGSQLRQRVGFDGRGDLLIGVDSFIGNIYEDNAQNTRVTGAIEGE